MKYIYLPVYSARRHSKRNKTHILDQLKKWYDRDIQERQPTYFISYTEINKVGINPKSIYDCIGVYCYPVRIIYSRIANNTVKFGNHRPFMQVLKRTSEKVLGESYTKAQYEKDKKKLSKFFDTTNSSSLSESIYDACDSINKEYNTDINPKNGFNTVLDIAIVVAEHRNNFNSEHKRIFYLWTLIEYLAALIDCDKSSIIWNTILRKHLNYDLVVDAGLGFIGGYTDYEQAIFLTPSAYKHVDTILSKEKIRQRTVSIGNKIYRATQLPEGLTVNEDLDLSGTDITALPKGLTVNGDLDLFRTNINRIPKDLTVNGTLRLSESKITRLPDNWTVNGNLDASGTLIKKLPDNLTVKGDLNFEGSDITDFSPAPKVDGNINLSYTHELKTIAEGLIAEGNLDLSFSSLQVLPRRLTVKGDLNVSYSQISGLPDDLKVLGDIEENGTKITIDGKTHDINRLPKDFTINKRLNLSGTPLRQLPDNLTVNGDLNISNTKLTRLPNNLTINGKLIFSLDEEDARNVVVPDSVQVDGEIESNFLRKMNGVVLNSIKPIFPESNFIGDLDLSNTKNIVLQEDLLITGSLKLHNSYIRLPKNLCVLDDIHLENSEIEFPEHMLVYGDLHITNCPNISSVPSSVRVYGKIIKR